MLRILTLNTWHGHTPKGALAVERLEPEGHKARRTRALLAGLRALDPDVVFFQECFPEPVFSAEVARSLGYDHASKICNAGIRVFGVGLPPGIGTGEGVSILAKRALRMKVLGIRRLSGIGFTNECVSVQLGQLRFALAAQIETAGRKVLLFNTHIRYAYPMLDTFHAAWRELTARGLLQGAPPRWLSRLVVRNMHLRDLEVTRLYEWVRALAGNHTPFVVGADFNLDHDHAQMRDLCTRLGALNVLPTVETPERAWTWDPGGNPNIAFSTKTHFDDGQPKGMTHQLAAHYDQVRQNPDHLLLGPTFHRHMLRDGGLAMARGFEGVFPSDHYGIWAEVRV